MATKKKATAHPTQSFQELVSQKTLDALRPFINQTINQTISQMISSLKQEQNRILLRTFNLERILMDKLGITEEQLIDSISDLEDTSRGYTKVSDEVQLGDFLRVEIAAKPETMDKFTKFDRYEVQAVAVADRLTFSANLENNMLGMKPGEEKEVTEIGQDGKTMVNIKVKINRISRVVRTREELNENNNG